MIVIIASIILFLWIRWIVNVKYEDGFRTGKLYEALQWSKAFDSIRPPNWQSLPVTATDPDERREQEDINKMYVQIFKVAKDVIGEELLSLSLARSQGEIKSKSFVLMNSIEGKNE